MNYAAQTGISGFGSLHTCTGESAHTRLAQVIGKVGSDRVIHRSRLVGLSGAPPDYGPRRPVFRGPAVVGDGSRRRSGAPSRFGTKSPKSRSQTSVFEGPTEKGDSGALV